MRIIWTALTAALLVCASVIGASAQDRSPAELRGMEFDNRWLNQTEKRLIQLGLSLSGDYLGLLDGDWGDRSQKALLQFAERRGGPTPPRNEIVFDILAVVLDAKDQMGFGPRRFSELDLAVDMPTQRLSATRDPYWPVAFEAANGWLAVKARLDPTAPALLHDVVEEEFAKRGTRPDDLYTVRTERRFVTAGPRADGGRIYFRSEATARGWTTLGVEGRSERIVSVIASSAYFGPKRFWLDAPLDGILYLASDLGEAAEPRRPPQSSTPPARAAPPLASEGRSEAFMSARAARSSGSGFFVNATDIVTNAHVVEECAQLVSPDRGALATVRIDTRRDLALLATQARSRAWLRLAAEPPRLGAGIYAVGYPFLGSFADGVSVTRGVASARSGFRGSQQEFTISAALQPGNSGGPILNLEGAVIGVAVARLTPDGETAQNVNYAVRLSELRAFLREAGAAAMTAEERVGAIDDGLPSAIETAVVPILCH